MNIDQFQWYADQRNLTEKKECAEYFFFVVNFNNAILQEQMKRRKKWAQEW